MMDTTVGIGGLDPSDTPQSLQPSVDSLLLLDVFEHVRSLEGALSVPNEVVVGTLIESKDRHVAQLGGVFLEDEYELFNEFGVGGHAGIAAQRSHYINNYSHFTLRCRLLSVIIIMKFGAVGSKIVNEKMQRKERLRHLTRLQEIRLKPSAFLPQEQPTLKANPPPDRTLSVI